MVMEESDMELASENIPVPQVQKPIVDTVKRNKSAGASRKPRLRKKALHDAILKQMEFYFSNANLSKDRYLSGLLRENPYIDLEVFTRCNKLRELSTDINRIAKALQGSTMLKVSEDGTKVCRLTPIEKKENIDECTIYVQNLPPDADHDWLISIFSKYGSVDYVSIPRYKSNRKIKGFAFVEFDTPSSAQECIKTFQKKGRVLPPYAPPNELLSITTFDEPNKDAVVGVINSKVKIKFKDNEKEKVLNEEIVNKDNNRDDTEINIKQSFKKRKYSLEKSLVTDESDIKVIKKKKKELADQNMTDQKDEKEKVSKVEFEDKDNTCDNEINTTDNNGRQNSKKRKHSSEKIVVDENDIKIRKKKKDINQSITDQQYEKKKILKEDSEDKINEIDAVDNNERQNIKKEKYVAEIPCVTDENDFKIKKKKKATDQIITNPLNEREKLLKEESENKDNTYDNEIDVDNNDRQSLKKKKLVPEKLYSKDERDIKVTGNSNIEIQDISNKKEKKKRKLTIDDTIITNDISGEVKKECPKPMTNSNKNKTTELEYPFEDDENNKADASLQTEDHSSKNVGMRNSDVEETSADERKKKKNRKKRSKIQKNDISNKIGLQVMAKSDWKRLRNRYLDLQRHKMSELKLHLRKAEVERGGIMTKNGYYDKTAQNNTLHDKSKYENDNENFNEEKSYGRVNYAPGIIVKIEMDEPCTDLQSFKMELKDNNSVKYIDITADSCEAYVRYDTAEAAQAFVQKSYEGRRLTVLEGEEEKLYWNKILEDRIEKLSKNKRVRQRGRVKLLKRAEKELGKCIKFDQD
ncbi:hypothetical protein PUN28_008829 [Cardiocondyla obscurior]|uniref:La-related protein 7 n=2 Tax=Cardiocondyla obscurior TaxID=286306 RepID=A0AAW2FUW3_9HYME